MNPEPALAGGTTKSTPTLGGSSHPPTARQTVHITNIRDRSH